MEVVVTQPTSRAGVQERIADWSDRITALFRRIEKWAQSDSRLPGPRWSEVFQLREQPMVETNTRRRKLPTLTFFSGKRRIAFVPSALWIIGANGRINLSVDGESFILVDMGGENGRRSAWKLVSRDARKNYENFNKATFMGLVRHLL